MPLVGTDQIDTLLTMGFSASNIIIGLGPDGWQSAVDFAVSRGVRRFYIDEPIQKSLQQLVRDAAPYIAASPRNGNLTISESYFDCVRWYVLGQRGTIGDMIDLALSITPSPFVSCHTFFDSCFPHNTDPRDQWTYIMGRVPNLFKMAWIRTRQDQSPQQIGLLFGHANNLGINQILLYPFEPGGAYTGRVNTADEQAWSQGSWLRRLQKQVMNRWCCLNQQYNPDECYFESSDYTGQTQWI